MLKIGTRNHLIHVHVQRLQQQIKVVVSNINRDIHQPMYQKEFPYHNRILVKSFFFNLVLFIWFLLDKGQIEADEDNALYKEIVLRQHAVPLGDLLQTTES
jgi:hypothetical protein